MYFRKSNLFSLSVKSGILLSIIYCSSFQSVSAEIFKWVDEHGKTHFSDKPPASKNKKSIQNLKSVSKKKATKIGVHKKIPVKAIKINATSNFKLLPNSIKLKLRSLLIQKKFTELNKVLDQFQQLAEADISQETNLFIAYKAFQLEDKRYAALFTSWVKQHPDAYQSYLARASFYYQLGWSSRGAKWSSETNEKQFDAMTKYFSKAKNDVNKSLGLNSKLMPSYSLLIGVSKASRNDQSESIHITSAINKSPASYEVRVSYLRAITPRWGGSFEAMVAFVEATKQYEKLNPRLKMLHGLVIEEAGSVQSLDGAYKSAIAFYTKALEYGETPSIFKKRGIAYSQRDEYSEALADYSKAIQLYSEDSSFYYRRAFVYSKLGEVNNAMSDIEKAGALDPLDKDVKKRKIYIASLLSSQGYKKKKESNYSAAIDDYNNAIRLNPNEASNFNQRARAFIDKNELEAAEKDIKRAIELDSKEYSYYHLLDWVLAKRNDWNQIISHWDRYIKINPKNSNAYVERGGAKYHKGDYKGALEDAKTAADMGNPQGKEAYRKVKRLVK